MAEHRIRNRESAFFCMQDVNSSGQNPPHGNKADTSETNDESVRGGIIRRISSFLLRVPLVVKVVGTPMVAVVMLGVVLAWQIQHNYQRLELLEVEEQAEFVGRIVAAAVAEWGNGDIKKVERLLETAAEAGPATGTAIIGIKVLDENGTVWAQSSNAYEVVSRRGTIEAKVPYASDRPGSVVVAVNDGHVDYEVGWHTRQLVKTTLVILALAIVATWLVMRGISQPVLELVKTVRAVKAGSLGSRVKVPSRDEVGELGTAFNDMLDSLEQKEAENHQLRRKLFLAQEEERRRVATELHDHTGQALTSLIAGLTAIKDTDRHAKEVAELVSLAAQALHEVHDLSRTLQPSVLHHLGLISALEQLCSRLANTLDLKVDFSAIGFEDEVRLPLLVELALYRIAQEAITNAVRHGRARAVEVLLHRRDSRVLAVFEDNGGGFEADGWRERCLRGEHLGLLSIEERATLLGGTLRIESRPGRGTSLFVDIPITDGAHAKN